MIGRRQRALICSRALRELGNESLAQGKSRAQVEQELSHIHLETAGGAAYTYPRGPHYHHPGRGPRGKP